MTEPTKVCSKCKMRKPWSAFTPRTYWPDGTVRRPQAWCRECHNERGKARHAANPTVKRADNRRRWREKAKNPEWREQERERVRQACVRLRRERGAKPRGYAVKHEPAALFPIGPFRAWLREQLVDRGSITVLAATLGLSERRVERLLNDPAQESVTLDVVDRAVVAVGEIWMLNELYPVAA